MTQYILLIYGNTQTEPSAEEWGRFIESASESGLFKGGSAIGGRVVLGNARSAHPSEHIKGYMRFDAENKQAILNLLQSHPVVVHGGSVELCELTES